MLAWMVRGVKGFLVLSLFLLWDLMEREAFLGEEVLVLSGVFVRSSDFDLVSMFSELKKEV